MPPLPLPENPDVELIEAVAGDMLNRLARITPDLSRDGMTEQNTGNRFTAMPKGWCISPPRECRSAKARPAASRRA